MKKILLRLFEQQKLGREEAREILVNMSEGRYNEAEMAALITVYLMRPISVEELQGFRDALLELCLPVELESREVIDLCGTGGDAKNTFNISTLASFVVAGAGYKVAKHGNYGVSSICGSSNVLEYLGYRFVNDVDILKRQMDKANICFLHAPLFHPAMKTVGPIRRQLGMKTFFNMLGPLVNPARPAYQLTGVFNLELSRLYQYLYQQSGKQYAVVHSVDGYDEVSLTGEFRLKTNALEQSLFPEDLGKETLLEEQLYGGATVEEAARIFTQVISGQGTPAQNDAVVVNAGLAIHCFRPDQSILQCMEEATYSLESGKAASSFKVLVK